MWEPHLETDIDRISYMTLISPKKAEYRPDIDGLRAVAVFAIILFHIDPRWLPGGFIGVDVFFVISGYLITTILARDLCEGRFTFRRFYERRIRRILPALWVLLLVCAPVSWLIMLPADAEAMGKSAIWSTLAMANVYFWHEVSTDYFAPQSAQLPFLHLWSLGVEEQFYVIWPALMLAVWRLARRRPHAIACTLAVSIVIASTFLAEWLLSTGEARFAYYMLPPRAGELALGSALALVPMPRASNSPTNKFAHVAAAIGWGLLAFSLVALSEHDSFPGWRALPPTIGAAALILSGQLAPTNLLLAPLRWAPFLWLGRCSYSAYLWHWPVLAWWRYLWGQPGTAVGIGILALILVLARTSQRWIEDPVRLSRSTWRETLAIYGLAPALLVGAIALLIARGDRWGLPLYDDSERKAWAELEVYKRPAHHVDWVCQQHVLDVNSLTDPKCEFGSGKGPARVLLLGDSHAAHFAPFFRVVADAQGVRMRSVALGSCAPLAGSLQGVVADSRLSACQHGVSHILQRARDFPLLIIGAAWAAYARNDPGVWARLDSLLTDLVAQGHSIWLLPMVPSYADYDAACPAKRVRVGDWLKCPSALVPRDDWNDTNARLTAIARRVPGVRFIPLQEHLCIRGAPCPVADAYGRNLYSDPSHLSVHGSNYLVDVIGIDRVARLRESEAPKLNSRETDR